MKNLIFVSVLFTIFSGTSLSASAQKRDHSAFKKAGTSVPVTVRFIEGIEINRDVQPHSEAIPSPVIVKTPETIPAITGIEESLSIQFKYAQLLNRDVESIGNLGLYKFIEDWWETRYRFGGTDKSGIDCSAFSGTLLSTVFTTQIPRTARDQYGACEKLDRERLAEGDLVFFNTRGGVSHVGVYLGDGYFVHASTTNGVTINNLDDDYYSARFLGGGRIAHNSTEGMAKTGVPQAVTK